MRRRRGPTPQVFPSGGARPATGGNRALARSFARTGRRARPAARLAALARDAIRSATDPASPDFLNYSDGAQPLVDCGFLAQACCARREQLWQNWTAAPSVTWLRRSPPPAPSLPASTTGCSSPPSSKPFWQSWANAWDAMRIDYALRQHQEWYKGDGLYGDGPEFHWDYYNSFVIQPMLLNVLRRRPQNHPPLGSCPSASARPRQPLRRHSGAADRPDGGYPAIGRSLAYRCGAFTCWRRWRCWASCRRL